MGEAFTIIAKVLPVIFLIIVGHFLSRFNLIRDKTVDDIKKLVVNLSLPAGLFLAFANTDFEMKYFLIVLAVFAACGIMLVVTSRLRRALDIENRYWPAVFAGFETGMMGYSIFVAVYGAAEMYKLAIMDLGQVTFVFFVLVSVLKRINGEAVDAASLIKSFIKTPIILAIVFGMLAGVINFPDLMASNPAGGAVLDTLTLISSLTMPLICIVIGFELKLDKTNLVGPFLTALVRIIALLGLAFLINRFIISSLLGLDKTFQVALYTMFLLPPPFVIPIYMSGKNERDKQFVLNTISIHIILTLFAFIGLILVVK